MAHYYVLRSVKCCWSQSAGRRYCELARRYLYHLVSECDVLPIATDVLKSMVSALRSLNGMEVNICQNIG